MLEQIIYADVCGSAQVSPKVVTMLERFFSRKACANPNANHALGMELMEKIERSRADISCLLGGDSESIIFNSGSSEGCASVFHDFHERNKMQSRAILYSAIEHPCTLENIRRYKAMGTRCIEIPHRSDGIIDLKTLEQQLEKHKPKLLCCV
jgi:cysteine desulfurase